MRLSQLKDECPKIPEDIRAMIEREVAAQIQSNGEICSEKSGFSRRSRKKILAVALAAAAVLGTTVFAGTQLYQWYAEREGKYGLKAGVDMQGAEGFTVPEEIPVLSFEAEYLPPGMIQAKWDPLKYHYSETPYQGGISICFVAMDEQISADKLSVSDTYVSSYEMLKLNDRDVLYLEKQSGNTEGISFDKKFYIVYPDYWQIAEVFVGEDVSKEEAVKVIQNLKAEPTGETIPLSGLDTWSDMQKPEEDVESLYEKMTATKEEMKNTHQIGEEFAVTLSAFTEEDEWIETDCITVKAADVQIADDFGFLDSAYIDQDMSSALDENGMLIQNEISYIASGDGIDTLDETLKTEKVNQKLVYVTLEFKNTGDEALKDILFLGLFIGLEEKENEYIFYSRAKQDGDDKTDSIGYSSLGGFGEMDYYDVRGGERNNNYISSIKPGETVKVNMTKIVNEDELDKMFLSLDGTGGYVSIAESALEMGYIDIRQ